MALTKLEKQLSLLHFSLSQLLVLYYCYWRSFLLALALCTNTHTLSLTHTNPFLHYSLHSFEESFLTFLGLWTSCIALKIFHSMSVLSFLAIKYNNFQRTDKNLTDPWRIQRYLGFHGRPLGTHYPKYTIFLQQTIVKMNNTFTFIFAKNVYFFIIKLIKFSYFKTSSVHWRI